MDVLQDTLFNYRHIETEMRLNKRLAKEVLTELPIKEIIMQVMSFTRRVFSRLIEAIICV